MNSKSAISTSLILLLAINFINYATAQEEAESATDSSKTGNGMIWKTCQQETIDNLELTQATEFCMANASQPWKGQRQNRGMAKNWCFRACQLKQLGWVYDVDSEDADAYQGFNRTKALDSVREIFPSDIHVRLQYGILKCAKSDAAEGLRANKPRCNSYAKLVRCIDRVVRVNCKRPKRTTTGASSAVSELESESTAAADMVDEEEMPSPTSTPTPALAPDKDDDDAAGRSDSENTDGEDGKNTEGNSNSSTTEEPDTE